MDPPQGGTTQAAPVVVQEDRTPQGGLFFEFLPVLLVAAVILVALTRR